jgi:hypothetical protein
MFGLGSSFFGLRTTSSSVCLIDRGAPIDAAVDAASFSNSAATLLRLICKAKQGPSMEFARNDSIMEAELLRKVIWNADSMKETP